MDEDSAYKVIAGKYGYPDSVPIQRVLEYIMTPQQAKIAALLPIPFDTVVTSEEIAAKLGIDAATVNLELKQLFHKGVIFPANFETMEDCHLPRTLSVLKDHTTMNSLRSDPLPHKELFELWKEAINESWHRDRAMMWDKIPQPPLRITPAYKSILDSPHILPSEDIREMIKAAPSIAVAACPCRQQMEALDRKCKHTISAACFHFGHGAEYVVNRGFGAKLSLEDALQLIDEAEDTGMVHSWVGNFSKDWAVLCNCCNDCCSIFKTLVPFQVSPSKLYAKSRYEARVEQDICKGCQVCIDRCPFDAIDMVKPADSKKLKAMVDAEKCMGCGVCVVGCESKALSMKLVRPAEHIPQA